MATPVFLFVGDSITEQGSNITPCGFLTRLTQDYVRKADLINRGCGGWTTKSWIAKLDQLIDEWQHKAPTLITIFLGANDAALKPGRDQHQHVPIQEYKTNLMLMLSSFQQAFPKCQYLLITPAAVIDSQYPSRSNDQAQRYAEACISVADQTSVPVLNLWQLSQEHPEYLRDGLHLSEKGDSSLRKFILETLCLHYPHLMPEALPMFSPDTEECQKCNKKIVGMAGAPLIVTLGDSITQNGANPEIMGYQVMLTQDYVRKADVVNRGCSGWTTRDWIPKLPLLTSEWKSKPPSLITIFLGANDAVLSPGQQHVDMEQYVLNLKHMLAACQKAYPSCKFMLMTPPPIDDTRQKDRTNAEAGRYAKACVRLAQDEGIPVVDFWTAMQGMMHLLADGLHFNRAGNIAAHALVLSAIRKHYPELAPEALPDEY